MCKKNWFYSFQKEKKFLSLGWISNHSLTIFQRLSQCLSSLGSSGFLNCCSLPGSSKEVISHNACLLLSPQFSLSDAPFLELQGGDQSPLLAVGVGSDWGLAQGLTWSCGHSWWVGPGAWQSRVGTPVRKRTQNTIRWHASLFVLGFLAPVQPSHRVAAQGADVVGISLGPPEVLQKPAQEKPSTTKGELENSGLLHWWAQRS